MPDPSALLLVLGALVPAAPPMQHEPTSDRPANHLAGETSPYLLQHLHNPVDWYPWGPEALGRAKEEQKPIFLSIGYSACHWCHVMERESFEDEAIAALMNEHFVCIKVDREERPDIDAIYMAAVQRMTGHGGWPMSVFLTPELEPFLCGTYYPPRSKYGRPGFDDVLRFASDAWTNQREKVDQVSDRMMGELRALSNGDTSGALPGRDLLATAVTASLKGYDEVHGGFGQPPHFAPKFPHCTQLTFLLRHGKAAGNASALHMAGSTLEHMARGGIYDQVGGGYARYSVDREWTVPHFEKMLYDNSQLALVHLEAWQALEDPFHRDIAREILDYVLREMTSEEGAFWSTTDADSEGEEGRFFVWSEEELRAVCGADADAAVAWFGVTEAGNFEGHNVLTARRTPAEVAAELGATEAEVLSAVERARAALYAAREERVHPGLDDKVLSSWNGLMLRAFARAAVVLDEPRYLEAARRNADFLLTVMRREDGRLFRTRRGAKAHLDGYLEDHAFVVQGLLDLYEADLDPRWLRAALELHEVTDRHFAAEPAGYYQTPDDAADVPVRLRETSESSLPSDIGVALLNAARLALLAGDLEGLARARAGLAAHAGSIRRYPPAFGQLVLLTDFLTSDPPEVFVVGERDDPLVRAELRRLQTQYPPNRVLALVEPSSREALAALLPGIEDRVARDGRPTVYECREGVCAAPRVLE
jgi:uncharacterized protein YyaL (SSP411 family)